MSQSTSSFVELYIGVCEVDIPTLLRFATTKAVGQRAATRFRRLYGNQIGIRRTYGFRSSMCGAISNSLRCTKSRRTMMRSPAASSLRGEAMELFREFTTASKEEKKALKKVAFWLSQRPDTTKYRTNITKVQQKDDGIFTVSFKQAVDQSWFRTDDTSKDFALYSSRIEPPSKKAKPAPNVFPAPPSASPSPEQSLNPSLSAPLGPSLAPTATPSTTSASPTPASSALGTTTATESVHLHQTDPKIPLLISQYLRRLLFTDPPSDARAKLLSLQDVKDIDVTDLPDFCPPAALFNTMCIQNIHPERY